MAAADTVYVSQSHAAVPAILTEHYVPLDGLPFPVVVISSDHFPELKNPRVHFYVLRVRTTLRGDAVAFVAKTPVSAPMIRMLVRSLELQQYLAPHLLGSLSQFPAPLMNNEKAFLKELLYERLRGRVLSHVDVGTEHIANILPTKSIVSVLARCERDNQCIVDEPTFGTILDTHPEIENEFPVDTLFVI